MESLRAFIKHQSSVLEYSTTTTESDESNAPKETVELPASTEGDAEQRTDVPSRVSFKTKYDIAVEAGWHADSTVKVSIRSGQGQSASSPLPHVAQPGTKFRYRIFPDWQKYWLWYLPIPRPGILPVDLAVGDEQIKERYPILYPFWSQWVHTRWSAFQLNVNYFYPKIKAVMSRSEILAWEINGFLMGCWMVLQEDVDSVIFQLDGEYLIRRDTMETELVKFLHDREHQLLSNA